MSEDLNRDPLVRKLTRLTPTTASLDRDAMLFAAGRASAPKRRGWKWATAALAVSQMATIVALLIVTRPSASTDVLMPVETRLPMQPSEKLPESSYGEMVRRMKDGELPKSSPMADPNQSGAVLTVAGSRFDFEVD